MWMFHETKVLAKLYSNETSMNLCSQKRMNIIVDVPSGQYVNKIIFG